MLFKTLMSLILLCVRLSRRSSPRLWIGGPRIDRCGRAAYAGAMRWDALFDDMEAQLAARQRLDFDAEIAERTRWTLRGGARGPAPRVRWGSVSACHLSSGSAFEGMLSHAGSEALVLDEPQHQVLIPYAAAAQLSRAFAAGGLRTVQRPAAARLGQRPPRDSPRNRAGLAIFVGHAARAEAALHGVIDRVGRDFLDLAVTGTARTGRAANVRQVAAIPFGALAGIRSPAPGYRGRRRSEHRRVQTSGGLGLGLFDHAAGLGIALLDVLLEHLLLDTPLAASAHLDCLELAAANERVGGRRVDLELLGNVSESQESGHDSILPPLRPTGAVIHSLRLFGPGSSRRARPGATIGVPGIRERAATTGGADA